MIMTPGYIDLHCHPSLKPYGKSFNSTAGENSSDRYDENSVWFYDAPNLFERAIQLISGVCKFRQSDFTSLAYGHVKIICASLYPIERGFFKNKLGTGVLSDLADTFVTSAGWKRVNYVQSVKNYFEDLEREYNFFRQCEGQPVKTDSGTFKYVLARDFSTVQNALSAQENIIVVVMSIEGMHALHQDIDAPDEATAMNNVQRIKQWAHVPFFVTVAHHFNNYLCGHARSLFNIVGNETDQHEGMDAPFSTMGLNVVKALLSKANGKRVHIDIKHMSAKARAEYIALLQTDAYKDEKIPIIMSHGACTGTRSMDDPTVIDLQETGPLMLNHDINFYDNELVAMARSQGIIGLQLDERRIAGEATLKHIKHSIWMNKIRHYRAELLWNQVQHIAELLDKNGLFAWD
ncbi:MAG TPA: hypothetical protein VIM64_16175, partial [Puia sp.]